MFGKIRRETVGGILVLIGFVLLIGFAGTSDIGQGGSVLALIGKGIVCLIGMTIGAYMIGGEADVDTL